MRRVLSLVNNGIALCAALVLGVVFAADARERVGVRVGEHPGFSRLVFDWPAPVGASLEQTGERLVVRFDRPADLDLARYRADPPPGLNGITPTLEPGGLAVTISVSAGAEPRLFEVDGKVVLDVRLPAAENSPAPAPPPAKPPGPETAETTQPAAVPVVPVTELAAPDPAAAAPEEAEEGAPIALLLPAPAQTPPAPAGDGPSAAPGDAAGPVDSPAAAPAAPPPGPVPPRKPAETAALAAPEAKPQPGPPPATAVRQRPPAERPATVPHRTAPEISSLTPTVIDTAPAPARRVMRNAPLVLRFEWPGEVAAAGYRRGGSLWLAFDRPPPRDLAAELTKLAPELAPIAQFEVAGGTLVQLTVPPVLAPRLRREGTVWHLDLWARGPYVGSEIPLEVQVADGRAEALFRLEQPGRVLAFVDPELGDRLIVVPTLAAGQALPGGHAFPQFQALDSLQGVVVQPLDESIGVVRVEAGVAVRAPDGLIASHGASLARLKANVPEPPRGPRLLHPEAWRRGDMARFQANKQDLQRTLAEAEGAQVAVARLDLARFYFGHGLAAEALGVLRLREADDPRLALDPEARLMKGASEFLTDSYEAAAAELFHPALDGEWEAELWHGAYAAASRDWHIAADKFARTLELIPAYPHAVRVRLHLLAAEASLGIADAAGAERYLDLVREDQPSQAEAAQVAFLIGRRMQLEGDAEAAEALWRRVAESGHAPSRIRARLALLDLGLEQGTVTVEEAVAELERLRYAWRGDQFEFALLQRLGDLYLVQHEYRKGLRALRQAAAQFPDSERAQAVAQRMRDVFTDLYLGEAGAGLPPLGALALYEEFKELTPPGARGDAVIAGLADRLVEVDLLDRAAELLESQVRYRLAGPLKARIGARLAVIRLLDGEPDQAMKALAASEVAGIPPALAAERRLLRVRALSETQRPGDALALLGEDGSEAALRLRADILWQQGRWAEAAATLGRLVPEQAPADRSLEPEESQNVLNLAIALTLAGDGERLRALGGTYREAMAGGPQAQTFALLVADLEPEKVRSVAEQLAQIDQVEAFIASYRQRLQSASLSELN